MLKIVTSSFFSCVERPLMMRTRRSFELKIVPKNLFFDFLNEVAVNENGFEWSVEVLFHNLKGYDGMFVLEEPIRQHRMVENQVCV